MGREVVSYPYDGPAMVRCSAHKKSGEQCKKWAIRGGTVCRFHGGAAGQVKRKAAARIEASLDRAAIAVVRLMEDADTPPAVKLAAARDLLDRGNLTGKQIVEVQGAPAPWQVVLQKIVVRATPEELAEDAVVDAEWREDPDPSLPPYADREPVVPRGAPVEYVNVDETPPRRLDPEGYARRRGTGWRR